MTHLPLPLAVVFLFSVAGPSLGQDFKNPLDGPPLPGTKKLTLSGDIASQIVDGVDRFLLREIELSVERRASHWNRDTSSPEKYSASIEPNRRRLAHIIGVRDERVAFEGPELVATTDRPALVGRGRRLRGAGRSLARLRRRERRGAAVASNREETGSRRRRRPRRRPNARDDRRPGRGRACPVAVCETSGRERLPCPCARADRPEHRETPLRPSNQPRVPLPVGVRAGPSSDRLRGAEGAGRRRLVLERGGRSGCPDRRDRLGRRRADRPVCRRNLSLLHAKPGARQKSLVLRLAFFDDDIHQ